MAERKRIDEHQTPCNTIPAGPILSGRALRFVLVDQIERHGTMTVAEMVRALDRYGFVLLGRASKIISDALRWELARGRVRRLRRGVYTIGRAPASTARRIRLLARRSLAWMSTTGRGQHIPASPTAPVPPWLDLRWLWST